MLGIYTWSVLITGIFFTSFGVFAYLNNKRELSNRLFGLLSLAFAIWCYAWFALLFVKEDVGSAYFWAKILNLGATLIPIFYMHWILSVLNLAQKKKYLIIGGYLLTFIFIIFNHSDFFIEGVHQALFFPFWPTPGPLYKWFLLFGYLGMAGYAFIELIKESFKASGEKKYQIIFIILGSILGFGGGATNFPLMYGWGEMQPFGVFAVMFAPFALGYAALRYNLMNIKVIATELFGAIISLILLINFLTSETAEEWFIRGLVLGFGLVSSILIIRGVLKEVRAREEIERLAKELEVANIRLRESDQAKSDFVTITSHQLRTPLTAVKGYVSMLLEGTYGPVPEKFKQPMDRVFQSSDRLVRLIGDFLNLSRIERGKMEYDFKKFDLKHLVMNLFDDFSEINKKRKVPLKFTLNIDENEKFIVTADEEKVRQAMSNLIDNALKYTKDGFTKISIYKNSDNDSIVFKVQDSGMGMDKDALARLFQKFTRAQNGNLSRHVDGTGLGLYVAREIMKAHDGDVWAESNGIGKGSSFFIRFPMKFITPAEREKAEREQRQRQENVEGFVKGI